MLEIEAKFAIEDEAGLLEELMKQGFQVDQELYQADYYFNHPDRDFRSTDEAFRIRVTGDQLQVTYKGPRLESIIKTRPEMELMIQPEPEALETAQAMLLALGFRPVASVIKLRRQGQVVWQGVPIAIAIDRVDDAGDFVELERVVDVDQQAAATEQILSLAQALGLKRSVKESYLAMVLRNRNAVASPA